jgi:rhamnose transport system substrate-binding protein
MEPSDAEVVFIAQVDFDETGMVMADMALSLLGEEGGQFAILSATPDASNQNAWIAAMQEVLENDEAYASLELVDIVYGNDQSEDSYNEALGLVDRYPDLKLIMAPTTVGIAAAAQAIQHEGLCGEITGQRSGPACGDAGLCRGGCAQEFALWSFHRPRLPDLLRLLPARQRRPGRRGRRNVRGRPYGHLHHRG